MPPAQLLKHVLFVPPAWAAHLKPPLHGRVILGHLPTPVMPWACPALRELGVRWSIKRDDLAGAELSGNKVRKLELLMADALAGGHDCVVTVGGLQSNHCRATAAAARLVGLEAHLVLLVADHAAGDDPGMQGNLLLDRLLGARLHLCAASDYYRYGGDLRAMDRLNELVGSRLRAQGRKPYLVPVGGTTPMSAWGYISAVEELLVQCQPEADIAQAAQSQAAQSGADPPQGDPPQGDPPQADLPAEAADAPHAPEAAEALPFDHIVFAAGSGGTATGLALGLAGVRAQLHAVNVQHTPDFYYEAIDAEAKALGCSEACEGKAREWLTIHDGSSIGYGHSTTELLSLVRDVCSESGVLLDHVYTGKALHFFAKAAEMNPEAFRGSRILFWHTGGLLGLYSKATPLRALLPDEGVQRLHVPTDDD